MSLAEVSIRRPVLAVVLSILIVVFGIVGFEFLGVREYPAVDPPVVTVTTNYGGASPEVVAAQITEPLEQSISGVAGIRVMSSTSRDGQSQIRVEFDLNVPMDGAANDVRDKVSVARSQLPADADPPIVEKADADSAPIVFLTLRSETKSIYEVAYMADTVVKERVQTLPGVASVRIFGDKRYAMRLILDPDRMAAQSITPGDIQAALLRENVDLPAGRLEGASTEMGLRSLARLSTVQEFNDLILRSQDGRILRLSDVGRAELSAENLRTGVRYLGVPMIGVAIIPQPNTNAIAIADAFYARLQEIQRVLPPEYQAEIGYDFTNYVRKSVSEVQETLVVAFALVAFIIFAFLRDWRATIIPVVAIPVCIVSAFFIMYVLGFSINILTLVGLVLAIGLVFVAAGVAGAAVGAARVARHRAQIAADLGALAGAARAIEGSEAACAQAARIAAANQGRVRSCVLQGLEIVVRADVTVEPLPGLARQASAAARAGPVTVAAPTGPWTGP